MALITRLSRLFQADFHAVLDRIEEPDIQLKQAIREMRLELQQSEQRLALLQHEAEQLAQSVQDDKTRLTAYDEELDICFSAKKEDLARDLIRRKLETTRRRQAAEKQITAVESSIKNLESTIAQYREQVENMSQKLELLASDSDEDFVSGSLSGAGVRNEEIEIAFLREKQKRSAS